MPPVVIPEIRNRESTVAENGFYSLRRLAAWEQRGRFAVRIGSSAAFVCDFKMSGRIKYGKIFESLFIRCGLFLFICSAGICP
jgi:hypothetical protein